MKGIFLIRKGIFLIYILLPVLPELLSNGLFELTTSYLGGEESIPYFEAGKNVLFARNSKYRILRYTT